MLVTGFFSPAAPTGTTRKKERERGERERDRGRGGGGEGGRHGKRKKKKTTKLIAVFAVNGNGDHLLVVKFRAVAARPEV